MTQGLVKSPPWGVPTIIANGDAPTLDITAPRVGDAIHCTAGTYTPPVDEHSFKWQYSADGGVTPVDLVAPLIPGYIAQSTDLNNLLRCQVIGVIGSQQSAPAYTAWTSAVQAALIATPLNTVAPSITGTATQGQTLTYVPGTWTGTPTPVITWTWTSSTDNVTYTAIPGTAGVSTYLLGPTDVGTYLKVFETATNGSTVPGTAYSAAKGAVASLPAGAPTVVTFTSLGPFTDQTYFADEVGTLSTDGTGTITYTIQSNPNAVPIEISGNVVRTTAFLVAGGTYSGIVFRATNSLGHADSAAQTLGTVTAYVPAWDGQFEICNPTTFAAISQATATTWANLNGTVGGTITHVWGAPSTTPVSSSGTPGYNLTGNLVGNLTATAGITDIMDLAGSNWTIFMVVKTPAATTSTVRTPLSLHSASSVLFAPRRNNDNTVNTYGGLKGDGTNTYSTSAGITYYPPLDRFQCNVAAGSNVLSGVPASYDMSGLVVGGLVKAYVPTLPPYAGAAELYLLPSTPATAGTITPGSGYVNGIYTSVPLWKSGNSAQQLNPILATVTVSGGAVTAVVITEGGSAMSVSSQCTTPASNLGGTGSGFIFTVSAVDSTVATITSFDAVARTITVSKTARSNWTNFGYLFADCTSKAGNYEVRMWRGHGLPTTANNDLSSGQCDHMVNGKWDNGLSVAGAALSGVIKNNLASTGSVLRIGTDSRTGNTNPWGQSGVVAVYIRKGDVDPDREGSWIAQRWNALCGTVWPLGELFDASGYTQKSVDDFDVSPFYATQGTDYTITSPGAGGSISVKRPTLPIPRCMSAANYNNDGADDASTAIYADRVVDPNSSSAAGYDVQKITGTTYLQLKTAYMAGAGDVTLYNAVNAGVTGSLKKNYYGTYIEGFLPSRIFANGYCAIRFKVCPGQDGMFPAIWFEPDDSLQQEFDGLEIFGRNTWVLNSTGHIAPRVPGSDWTTYYSRKPVPDLSAKFYEILFLKLPDQLAMYFNRRLVKREFFGGGEPGVPPVVQNNSNYWKLNSSVGSSASITNLPNQANSPWVSFFDYVKVGTRNLSTPAIGAGLDSDFSAWYAATGASFTAAKQTAYSNHYKRLKAIKEVTGVSQGRSDTQSMTQSTTYWDQTLVTAYQGMIGMFPLWEDTAGVALRNMVAPYGLGSVVGTVPHTSNTGYALPGTNGNYIDLGLDVSASNVFRGNDNRIVIDLAVLPSSASASAALVGSFIDTGNDAGLGTGGSGLKCGAGTGGFSWQSCFLSAMSSKFQFLQLLNTGRKTFGKHDRQYARIFDRGEQLVAGYWSGSSTNGSPLPGPFETLKLSAWWTRSNLSVASAASATTITVKSINTLFNGDTVKIALDDGTTHTSTISGSVTNGSSPNRTMTFTLGTALPSSSGAAAGRAVTRFSDGSSVSMIQTGAAYTARYFEAGRYAPRDEDYLIHQSWLQLMSDLGI